MGSTLVSEPYAKACVLNDHFRLQCSAFASPDLNAVQQPQSAAGPQFQFLTISPADIAKKLRGLPGWKSCGRDNVTNMLLKLAADQVSDSISVLFNRSLQEGAFPTVWKELLSLRYPKKVKTRPFRLHTAP